MYVTWQIQKTDKFRNENTYSILTFRGFLIPQDKTQHKKKSKLKRSLKANISKRDQLSINLPLLFGQHIPSGSGDSKMQNPYFPSQLAVVVL